MRDAPEFARVAALLGDPARARMLAALMGGIALTATELAGESGIAASTASSHLAKLADARLVAVERQGRHRYFRLFDAGVADMLEQLMCIAAPPVGRPSAPPPLRAARVCYDHLAGERGVWLLARLRERALVTESVSSAGEAFFARLGIDVPALAAGRRPLFRCCLDWTERRHHLAGALGAAILDRLFALRWARRETDGRAVIFSPAGDRALRGLFGA